MTGHGLYYFKEDCEMLNRNLFMTFFMVAALAAFGCSSSQNGDKCTDGDQRCAGDTGFQRVEKCVDSKWITLFTCESTQVCQNNQCVLPSVDGDLEEESSVVDGDLDFDFIFQEQEEEEEAILGCTHDRDCTPVYDYYCDLTTNKCKKRLSLCQECTTNRECGMDSDLCINNPSTGGKVCGYSCGVAEDCPDNFTCSSGQCILDAAAIGSGACCVHQDCATVPDKPVCNFVNHKCIAGCKDDAECSGGQVCASGLCIDGCSSSSDCAQGQVCDLVTRLCFEGDCYDKADCSLEYLCDTDTHTCVEGCDDDGDCLGANECKLVAGVKKCVERTGCENTGDCKIGFYCNPDVPDVNNPERGSCQISTGPYTCCGCESNEDCGNGANCFELKFEDEEGNHIEGKIDYKACLATIDCKRWNEDHQQVGTIDCPRGFTCGEYEDQQSGQKYGICVVDCNTYCPIPEHVDVCTNFSTQHICPLQ